KRWEPRRGKSCGTSPAKCASAAVHSLRRGRRRRRSRFSSRWSSSSFRRCSSSCSGRSFTPLARSSAVNAMAAPRGALVLRRDEEFLRLAQFLLTRNGFAVESTKKIVNAVELIGRERLDVVVLDASDSMSETARTTAAIEALHPQVGVLLVCDDERPRPATGLAMMEKWEALETLADDIRGSYASATT